MTTTPPRIYTTAEVAEILGWDVRRTRRWLLRTGAGKKRGGRVVTTLGLLAEHFPEAWREVAIG